MHQPLNSDNGEVDDYGSVTVTPRELGSVLGLSEYRISALKRLGVLQAVQPGRHEFFLGRAVRAYVQYKCGQDSESQADFHKERALKERANRVLREILVEQTRGQLHPAQAVQFLVQTGNDEIRSQLSAFGDRLALELAGKDPSQIKTLIDTAVRKVLLELREYNPRDYYRRSKIAPSSAGPIDSEPRPGPGWKKGRPRPHASEANKKRWAADPQKLKQTLEKMNAARFAIGLSEKSKRKMSRSQRKRMRSMPPEELAAHMAKMRARRWLKTQCGG
jgi:hypothetical protein